jgi:hypothetical protein
MPSSLDAAPLNPVSWERMAAGIEKVKDRLIRASKAMANENVPYAAVGGNAVAAWVSRVDESVVRNTQEVDILIRREDFDRVKMALEAAGLPHKTSTRQGQSGVIEMFLDGPGAKAQDAIHIIFAKEKVKSDSIMPSPDVDESEDAGEFTLLSLEALVTMKLTSYRDKDRVHLRDMIEIGQIDASWLDRVPPPLKERLQALIDDPFG